MAKPFFILYVAAQERSSRFYRAVLDAEPDLDMPGMTEFRLDGGASLGLMPEAGIRSLLGEALPDPAAGAGTPRAEVYLLVEDAEGHHRRALDNGARELSPLQERGWGHRVAYCLDPDAHVLAFAEECDERSAP